MSKPRETAPKVKSNPTCVRSPEIKNLSLVERTNPFLALAIVVRNYVNCGRCVATLESDHNNIRLSDS